MSGVQVLTSSEANYHISILSVPYQYLISNLLTRQQLALLVQLRVVFASVGNERDYINIYTGCPKKMYTHFK